MELPQKQPYRMNWKPLERQAPDWFRDAKFGLFFHWGPYSVPACENEWYSRNMYAKGLPQNIYHTIKYGKVSEFGYKDFYKEFKGERFNPEEWAALTVRAGAKYAGPVSEHADNFSMWDSSVNPVNSVNYGPHRDVMGELEQAMRAKGLRFIATFHHQWLWGWFMSSDPDADVYDPDNEKFYGKALPLETSRMYPYRLPDEDFNKNWQRKINEVIDKYNPDLVYFDSRTEIMQESTRREFLDYYYNGPSGREDRIMTYKLEDFPVNTGVFDVECGRFADLKSYPWQTDDRLEDRVTWCYVEKPKYKPASRIIHQLCDVVSKNGNLLLNVGPKADGTIPEEARSVLYEIGDWLSLNGEAIYATRPFEVYGEGPTSVKDSNFNVERIKDQIIKGSFSEDKSARFSGEDIRFTVSGRNLYAILLGQPKDQKVIISSLREGTGLSSKKIEKIDLLGGAQNLKWDCNPSALTVQLRGRFPSAYANVLKITYADQLA